MKLTIKLKNSFEEPLRGFFQAAEICNFAVFHIWASIKIHVNAPPKYKVHAPKKE